MNIWKRFLSLAIVFALVLSMGPIIPFVQANAETETAAAMQETVWDFAGDALPADWTSATANAYNVVDGKLVWSDGGKAAGNNSALAYINSDEAVALTNYEASVVVSMDHPGCEKNYYPMTALIVRRADAKNYIRIDVRPNQNGTMAPTVRQYVNNASTNITSTGTKTTITAATYSDDAITFKLSAKVAGENLTVYIDDQVAWKGTIDLTSGTAGVMSFATASTTTVIGQAIEYDDFTITPVVVPANEELDSNDGTAALDTNLWGAAGTASNGAISILPGSNTGNASNYFGTAMSDGWIKADITLPTISEAELQTNKEGTGAMFYGVRMKNGSATIEADIWYQRNTSTSATAPKTGTTTLRLYFRNTGYTNGAFGPTISLPTDIWTTGATITLELRKVGNFIELKATCPTIAGANKTVACTVDTSEFIAGNWQFGLFADNPLLYTDWTLANKVDGTAYFDNIEVGRINKTASVTVDPTAAALVGLPSVDEFWIYNKAAGVTSGNPHARDAYQVRETIALETDSGYDYYANGEKIEDPDNFVIPNAETVTITAVEQEIPPVSATYADGVYEAGKWTTASTSAYVSESFANGYIEAEFAISGEINHAANMFVRSPKTAAGVLFGKEEEIMFRWTVVADTTKEGYTHKATSALVIRDNADPGYKLASDSSIHGTSKTVYLNIQEGAPATLKVKMEIIGNLLRIYVNGELHEEATFDPQYRIASQAGFFGYYGLSANATVTSATVQEVKAYTVTVPENVVADETEHLIKPYDTYGSAFGRTHYIAGETVTLSVDETLMDAGTLAVKTASGVDVAVEGGMFTMPAEAVVVTCDKLVTYSITEDVDGLSVNKTEAPAGTEIIITLDDTLDVTTLAVKTASGADVPVADGKFIMPAEAVTITCDVKQLSANEELYNSTGKTGFASTDGWNRNGTFADTSTYIYNTLMTEGAISVSFDMPEAALDSYSSNPSYNAFALLYNENGTAIGNIEASLYLSRTDGTYDYSYIRLGFRDTEYGSGINARKDITVCSGTNRDDIWGQTVTITLRKVGNYVEATFSFSEKPSMNQSLGWVVTETMENTAFKFRVNQTVQPATISDISVKRINKTASVVIDTDLVKLPTVYQLGTSGPTTTVGVRNAYQVGESIALGVDPTADVTTLEANDVVIADHEAFVIPDAEAVTITCNKLTLNDNQTLYSYNGTGALPTDLWSAAGTLTDNKLTTVTSKYNTAIEDGWISATVKMPESLPTDKTQVVIEAIEQTSKLEIEFGFLGGANYRAYIRRGSVDTNYAVANNSFMVFPVGQTSVGDVAGKEVTLSMRKVGNYFELHIYCEGVIDATHGFTMGDITAADGTVLAAIDDAKFNFGVSFPAFGGMTVESIEIGRMNKVATVTVDADSKDLIEVPQFKDPKDTKVLRDRTAYQIGETIALTVDPTAKNVKANGVPVGNTQAFVINENVVLTAELDTDPYYVNDFSANYDGLTLGSINLDGVECGRFTHTDGQLVITKDAGVDKNAQILATMATHDAVLANGFVTSLDITAYKQKTAEGADTVYPWILFTVNNKIQFRVIPAPTEDAPNRYGFVINNGESAGWVNAEGTGTSSVVWHYIELPGTMNTGTDGGVTYNVAVKLVGNAYTMYINGQQVFAGTTTADLSTNNVTFGGATSGGNTRGFTLKFDNLRIDRIGSVDEVVFGQKQLALEEDLAMDFYIALPTDTTATTATITLGGKEIAVVDLAKAERKVLVDNNMVGWYSWYVVTANVPVKDIAKDIVVTLNDTAGTSTTYSVKKYADYVLASDHELYVPYHGVAQALLDYGATAATYFADRTGSAELDAALAARLDAVSIEQGMPIRTGTNEYINLYGCSLEAVEKTNITMYFKVSPSYTWNDSVVVVKMGDTVVNNYTITNAGNGYMQIKINGIHAADLDVTYTVSVDGIEVSYSGLSYAYTANASEVSGNLKAMAKALYAYWAAAQAMN